MWIFKVSEGLRRNGEAVCMQVAMGKQEAPDPYRQRLAAGHGPVGLDESGRYRLGWRAQATASL